MKKIIQVLILAAAIIHLNSCQKETIIKNVDPVKITSQNEFVDNTYLEIQGIALAAIGSSDLSFKNESADALLGCAVITRDTLSNPKTILVDFSGGCVYKNKVYAGSILVTYNNNNMRLAGSEAKIEFNSVTVDGNAILGNVKIKNYGTNANGNLYGDIDVLSNVTFTGNAGSINGSFHYEVERFINNPNDNTDDHYTINGNGSGVDGDGHAITRMVVQDLVRKVLPDCKYFVSGQIRTEIDNQPEQLLDYGNGTCDNTATLTVSGNSQEIIIE
ncbi:MAG: hypothetical protein IPH78_14215 [Bacteroidetes bacterium]|nr:hypothetical protein [Bacteroidota bacterium]MBK8659239.1 hypothetical protein [Bacteroidota bacterium]